jgi:hypothetical protein
MLTAIRRASSFVSESAILNELIRDGLATATPEAVPARKLKGLRMVITDSGRQKLGS